MSDATVARAAYDALDLGRENKLKIDAHEDLCAERYGNINTTIGEIKALLKWAGGAMFTVMVSGMAFLISQTLSANKDAAAAAASKIEMLQMQQRQQPPVR